MTSLDPFLDQEYEEDDELGMGGAFGGLPGSSSQQQPAVVVSSQAHQYSPSSTFGAAPNVYYDPATTFEVPTTSFYGAVQSQPLGGGYAIHQPPTQYMAPMFDHSMQQQVYVLQQPDGSQQMYLHPVQPAVIRQQQPQYQFEQHETMQQQQVQSSSSDHSYASYSDAIALYDDGSGDAPSNLGSAESRPLRDAPAKPMGRMVVKKRPAIERRVGETDSASAAAVRRISSEEGWKSMNGWLKAAESDTNKLLQLLGQCREAKVTVTLLRSNDTPKFIRKLSKNHKDEEVRALSLSIVTKWKKVVNTTDVVEEKKEQQKRERKKEEESKEGEEQEEDENLEMKNHSLPVSTRRSSDEGEKKKDPKKDREHRAKAKVYQSKGRSTGLEGDDGANPAKKRSVNDTSPPNGAPPTKKSSTEKTPTAAAGTATTPPPKKPAPTKKITTSSSFMDSLLSPAASAAPKKKVLPKRPISRPEVKLARHAGGEDHDAPRGVIDMLLSPNADGKVVMEGLFADTSRSLKDDRVPSPPTKPTPAAAIFVAEEPDIAVGRRKIRFADEHGGALVETRFFEIEEGERINVNRFTPEEMKHYEAVQENKWMRDNSGMNNEDDDDDVDEAAVATNNPWLMPAQTPTFPFETGTATGKWRFVLADAADRTDVAYGSQSQMKGIQERRQQTAMKAFYLPNERCSHFDEPENQYDAEPEAVGAGLRLEPVAIPTEPVFEEEEIDGVAMEESQQPQPTPIPSASLHDSPAEPEASAAQPAMNDRLQALLNGLKTQGLLHDGSAEAAAAAENAASINPLSVPPPGLNVMPAVIPTTSTYYQEPPMNGFQQPARMHQIQQEFPVQPQPPAFVPGGGTAASSSGIQVVNMDVHGPPPPMGMPHHPHGGPDAPFPPYHPGPGRHFYVSHKPCTFFNSPRGCKFGDKCGFAHVVDPSLNGGGGLPGPFRGGMRGAMRGGGGEFRGGPPRGAFRGRGFGGPPPMRGMDHRDGPLHRGDIDMRRGGNWRDERRERRRSRSRSPSPSRRDRDHRDRDHRSSRREETKDIDLRTKVESRPAEEDDIDGVPITSPVA